MFKLLFRVLTRLEPSNPRHQISPALHRSITPLVTWRIWWASDFLQMSVRRPFKKTWIATLWIIPQFAWISENKYATFYMRISCWSSHRITLTAWKMFMSWIMAMIPSSFASSYLEILQRCTQKMTNLMILLAKICWTVIIKVRTSNSFVTISTR